MTDAERAAMRILANSLDEQVSSLTKRGKTGHREFDIAMERLEEGAMWIRKAIETA